jgi:protein phosphatase
MRAFDHASCATKGARDYQEDTSAFWPPEETSGGTADAATADATRLVAVLADGMGGHAAGALASRMVCENFISAYAEMNGSRPERLLDALSSANEAIAEQVRANPILSGMGTTLVAAVFGEEGVEWVSVGDSPLLLFHRGEVLQLNWDHSLAPELDKLAELGCMTMEEAKADPRRHMLRSAVTGDDIDLVDFSKGPLALEQGDYVILASDGLQTLETAEIGRVVAAYAADGAAAVASALIRAVEALRDPHQDNTTVIAVRPLAGGRHVRSDLHPRVRRHRGAPRRGAGPHHARAHRPRHRRAPRQGGRRELGARAQRPARGRARHAV